jgi:hypothetical protein
MAQALTTERYKLFPSPRNAHRVVFEHEVFVPHMYTLIDLASFALKGRASLFAAHRLADGKNGQLVTFELEVDVVTFHAKFRPD